MAGRTIIDRTRRCKDCAAFDRVSLTLEFCTFHRWVVFSEDRGCPDFIDPAPWLNWTIDGAVSAAHEDGGRTDQ